MLLDGALGQDERFRDGGVALALGHLGEHLVLARREIVERRVPPAAIRGDQRLDHGRVDHRAALGDDVDRRRELLPVVDAFLQQIAATLRTCFEEAQGIARIGMLAQHDHADMRMILAELGRDPDPLVVPGRRHADVEDRDIRVVRPDRLEQGFAVLGARDELDALDLPEHLTQGIADQVRVVRDDDADRSTGLAPALRARVLPRPCPSDHVPDGLRLSMTRDRHCHPDVRARAPQLSLWRVPFLAGGRGASLAHNDHRGAVDIVAALGQSSHRG